MARRLKTLAQYINDHLAGFEAKVVVGYCNTDRQLSGTRIRVPGKGRYGSRIKVRRTRDKKLVLDHNAAETYRTNGEVEYWLERVEGGWKPDTLNAHW